MIHVIPKWQIACYSGNNKNFEIYMDTDFPSNILELLGRLSYSPDVTRIYIEKVKHPGATTFMNTEK